MTIIVRLTVYILLSLLTLSCGPNRQREESRAGIAADSDLPDMPIELLSGDSINAKSLYGRPVVLVLFQPDCDHCQREAAQIRQHLGAFEDYELYFVSSSGGPDVQKFSHDYGLSGHDNVIFGVTTVDHIIDNFGGIQAPSMYIYNDNGALVQALNGEVDISVILKYL